MHKNRRPRGFPEHLAMFPPRRLRPRISRYRIRMRLHCILNSSSSSSLTFQTFTVMVTRLVPPALVRGPTLVRGKSPDTTSYRNSAASSLLRDRSLNSAHPALLQDLHAPMPLRVRTGPQTAIQSAVSSSSLSGTTVQLEFRLG